MGQKNQRISRHDDMDQLLSRAVQKNLTTDAPRRLGGCLAYNVYDKWAAIHLRKDPSVTVVMDAGALKEALNRPQTGAIFVPLQSSLTIKLIDAVCDREGQAKIIYTEVNDNE